MNLNPQAVLPLLCEPSQRDLSKTQLPNPVLRYWRLYFRVAFRTLQYVLSTFLLHSCLNTSEILTVPQTHAHIFQETKDSCAQV